MAIDKLNMAENFSFQLECAHEVTGAEMKCTRCGQLIEFKPNLSTVETNKIDWATEYLKSHDV